jgi:hypothetical protein
MTAASTSSVGFPTYFSDATGTQRHALFTLAQRVRSSGSARDALAVHLAHAKRNQLCVNACNATALAPFYEEFNDRSWPELGFLKCARPATTRRADGLNQGKPLIKAFPIIKFEI